MPDQELCAHGVPGPSISYVDASTAEGMGHQIPAESCICDLRL